MKLQCIFCNFKHTFDVKHRKTEEEKKTQKIKVNTSDFKMITKPVVKLNCIKFKAKRSRGDLPL